MITGRSEIAPAADVAILRAKSVLVVDDHPLNRTILEKALESYGMEVQSQPAEATRRSSSCERAKQLTY